MKFKILNLSIGLAILVYHIFHGYKINPDSMGYIEAAPIRSSGYSLIVLLFQKLFHGFALKALHIFQVSFLFLSIQYFLRFLKNYFQITDLMVCLISLLVYFYMYRFGNIIGSEPIAYALFLYVVKFLLEFLFNKKFKSFLIFCILLSALVLVRAQFYFFYPMKCCQKT